MLLIDYKAKMDKSWSFLVRNLGKRHMEEEAGLRYTE